MGETTNVFGFILFLIGFFTIGIAIIAWFVISNSRAEKKVKDAYRPSKAVEEKFRAKYPGIKFEEQELVWEALKSYFDAIKSVRVQGVVISLGMPSKMVDDLWHEFILDTRNYMAFCEKFYDGYIHHNPGDVVFKTDFTNDIVDKDTLKTFKTLKSMNVDLHDGLPLLFVIDEMVDLKGGYRFNAKLLEDQLKDESKNK